MKAELHIETGLRNNKTFLKKAYHTTPFKIANITEDKASGQLTLMLMTSSPGILDGDEYQIKINVAEHSSLQLQTQSYQRLFDMKEGASQHLEVVMGKGSSFCYLPHPSVPHKSSDFTTRNKIYLSHNCNLIWGEVLTCGRKLNGEEFKFTKYHNVTEVYLNNKLVIKENLLIRPSIVDVNSIGQLEGYTHQASLIYLNEAAQINTLTNEILVVLSQYKDVEFGVSALPVNGLIIRLLGNKGEQLHNMQKEIARYLMQSTNNKLKTGKAVVYAS